MSIEQEFEDSLLDPTQHVDREDLSPDELRAALEGLRRVVEDICTNGKLVFAITSVLNAVTRSYEPELRDPRFKMSADERAARDQWNRGVIAGLARAREYITTPRYAGELIRLLNPETDQED